MTAPTAQEWAEERARELTRQTKSADWDTTVRCIAAALAEAAKQPDGPGTLIWRMGQLAKFTQKEFGHDPLSAYGFETTLYEGVKKLREELKEARAEGEARGRSSPDLAELVAAALAARNFIRNSPLIQTGFFADRLDAALKPFREASTPDRSTSQEKPK